MLIQRRGIDIRFHSLNTEQTEFAKKTDPHSCWAASYDAFSFLLPLSFWAEASLVPQGQKASDYVNSGPVPPRQNVVPRTEKRDSSQQGLEFLFSPLLKEYYNPIRKNFISSKGLKVWELVDNHLQDDFKDKVRYDFEESFTQVCWLGSSSDFRLLHTVTKSFPIYQMDMKMEFLNGLLKEEVYVSQPEGFVDPDHLEKVYLLRKALYRL
ncbi:retrovirus-related pol polyprotein from transposon TNT 1-94 [Tanacetum coccineum]